MCRHSSCIRVAASLSCAAGRMLHSLAVDVLAAAGACRAPVLRISLTSPGIWHELPSPASLHALPSTGIHLFCHQSFGATVFLGLFSPSIGTRSGVPGDALGFIFVNVYIVFLFCFVSDCG